MQKLLALFTTVLLLAGCGSDVSEGKFLTRSGNPLPSTDRREFDPPTKFDTQAAVQLPPVAHEGVFDSLGSQMTLPPLTLVDTVAYIASVEKLVLFDTATGRTLDTFTPEKQAVPWSSGPDQRRGTPARPPVKGRFDGKDVLAVPFLVKTPGQGTYKDQYSMEMLIVDVHNRKLLTRVTVPFSEFGERGEGARFLIAAVSDSMLIVVPDTSRRSLRGTYGVDVEGEKVMWEKEDFYAQGLQDDMLIGSKEIPDGEYSTRMTVAAYSLAGEEKWVLSDEYQKAYIHERAKSSTLVEVYGARASRKWFIVVKNTTGEVTFSFKPDSSRSQSDPYCNLAQEPLVVCGVRSQSIGAYIRDTGEEKWHFNKKGERKIPSIVSVRKNNIYTGTSRGPVVLDAETGEDLETEPGISPVLVNGYMGIVPKRQESFGTIVSTLYAYPAVG